MFLSGSIKWIYVQIRFGFKYIVWLFQWSVYNDILWNWMRVKTFLFLFFGSSEILIRWQILFSKQAQFEKSVCNNICMTKPKGQRKMIPKNKQYTLSCHKLFLTCAVVSRSRSSMAINNKMLAKKGQKNAKQQQTIRNNKTRKKNKNIKVLSSFPFRFPFSWPFIFEYCAHIWNLYIYVCACLCIRFATFFPH